jgi:hypothetical protein
MSSIRSCNIRHTHRLTCVRDFESLPDTVFRFRLYLKISERFFSMHGRRVTPRYPAASMHARLLILKDGHAVVG